MKGSIFKTIVYCCILCSSSCNVSTTNKIIVAAAASTQYVLDELIEYYQKEHAVVIETIISSSGKLTAQIEQGALIDLFLSADTLYPSYLEQHQIGIEQPVVYARGKVVLWTYGNWNVDEGLNVLTAPSVDKIALADPKTAPYGELSKMILEDANLYALLKEKLVFGESISQVNQYVTTQSVAIGLTAKSVVMAPHLKEKGLFKEIANYELPQGMLLLTKHEQAKSFYQFLQSEVAQSIFEKYGYAAIN